jgi:hypothetical protein
LSTAKTAAPLITGLPGRTLFMHSVFRGENLGTVCPLFHDHDGRGAWH